jgi:hypothetical protein
MIPQADIVAWRRAAPWADDSMEDRVFLADVLPTLIPGTQYDPSNALEWVSHTLVSRLSGSPWQGKR